MTSIYKITLSIDSLILCIGQVQLDTENEFSYFCNIFYSFFLKQNYYQIPVKGELWNSIVVFLYKSQFSLDTLYLASEDVRLCCSLNLSMIHSFWFFNKVTFMIQYKYIIYQYQ